MTRKDPLPGTMAVWGGEEAVWADGATQVPVTHAVAFAHRDLDEWLAVATKETPGHIYSRNTNPTVSAFEEKVRMLEGGEAAVSAATGMAAISSTLYALTRPGDRIVTVKDTYGGTSKLFTEFLPSIGVQVVMCETDDHEAIEAAVNAGCDLLYLETPTNPTLKVLDLARLCAAGGTVGAITVVDNTFATPLNQRPLDLGADLVVHSATKFLGGHADALGGVVVGSEEAIGRVYHHREIHGAALDPMAAYLLLRGMKTLHLRIARQNASALEIARHLEQHPKVVSVHYPGLRSHPHHDVAARQMSGFGGVLSFRLGGGLEEVARVIGRLRFAHAAANLGAVETIVGPPATTSHVECTVEERAALGIPEGLIRYSTGIEDHEDLVADLDGALEAV